MMEALGCLETVSKLFIEEAIGILTVGLFDQHIEIRMTAQNITDLSDFVSQGMWISEHTVEFYYGNSELSRRAKY